MPADTSVKHFDSSMLGAPQITVASSTSAGKLIDVLVACLRDGFGLVTVTSLVVSGGVATATIAGGHPAKLDTVVMMAGSTPGELNGEKKVTAVTATTVQFDATGIADQTATGTITLKMAPAGWVTPFSGTNLLALKSGDAGATGALLRVDDTGATDARVVVYETMSDINTGTGKAPTDVQLSGGQYISRGNTAAGTRKWWVAANARFVHIGIAYSSTYPDDYLVYSFGDVASRKAGDAYKFGLFCQSVSRVGGNPNPAYCNVFVVSSGAAESVVSRSYQQTGSAITLGVSWMRPQAGTTSGSGVDGSANWQYPNGPDNGLLLSEIYLTETVSFSARGKVPGAYASSQKIANAFAHDERVGGIAELPGKTLLAKLLGSSSTATRGWGFLDITGPWAV